MMELVKAIDKASGYITSQNERDVINSLLLTTAEYQYSKYVNNVYRI